MVATCPHRSHSRVAATPCSLMLMLASRIRPPHLGSLQRIYDLRPRETVKGVSAGMIETWRESSSEAVKAADGFVHSASRLGGLRARRPHAAHSR